LLVYAQAGIFCRASLIREFFNVYGDKVIDRAISGMLEVNMLAIIKPVQPRQGINGALYVVNDSFLWYPPEK
ncbi:MAG: hypothetical protein V3T17_06665, partial [Pseudomonadales bacterium]